MPNCMSFQKRKPLLFGFFTRKQSKDSPKKNVSEPKVDSKKLKGLAWGIKKEMLEGILEIAKEKYPSEFIATLVQQNGVIYEINLLPGTIEGHASASLRTYMQPPDLEFKVVGSVHSHPSGNYRPSGADLFYFSKSGNVHIIVGYPYSMNSWQAYDRAGNEIELKVVD